MDRERSPEVGFYGLRNIATNAGAHAHAQGALDPNGILNPGKIFDAVA